MTEPKEIVDHIIELKRRQLVGGLTPQQYVDEILAYMNRVLGYYYECEKCSLRSRHPLCSRCGHREPETHVGGKQAPNI